MLITARDRYLNRWGGLKTERSSWISHYQDITNYLLPRAGRYFTQDRNRGEKRHNNIYDSTATRANRILAAGMMAGMTSPARPWFRLATADPGLMEYGPVKMWLDAVAQLMRDVFARSNTYRALHSLYEELGAFGTVVNIIESNFETVMWNTPLTTGEFCIATDDLGRVNTVYREFEMTVAQMVAAFGEKAVSQSTKNLWDTGKHFDAWVKVLHLIEPRAYGERDVRKRDARNMPFKSCYLEIGTDNLDLLRDSGFKRFPGLGARWHVAGGDIYGNSPGMDALGDIKQLQHQQLRKAQGIDYMVKPPLQASGALKGRDETGLPGGVTFFDTTQAGGALRPAFEVRLDLNHLLADIQDVRQRINGAFYADLFLMLANDTRQQPPTATEVAERHEEKLLMLGPVLERLHNELLDPLIDITFDKLLDARVLPPPPPELNGMDLKVEFVSTLAQAQRAVGLGAVERLLGTVMNMAVLQSKAGQPATVLDKIDTDQAIDKVADMLGVDPSIVVADDKVALIRDERAKAQQAAQSMALAQQAATAARDASAADTSGKNMLTDVMQQFQGYSLPTGVAS